MSLQKIGNLTNTFKSFKSNPFENMAGMVASLSAIGNVDKAAKYLKINNDGIISDKAASMLLFKAYKNSDITKEAATAAYANATASSGGLGSLFGGAGLMAGIKSAGSGLLTVLGSIAPALLGLLGVGIAFKAGKTVWDNILTNNGAKKRYQESSEKYSTAKSELDELQSQYDSNHDRIYELRAQENRSTSENAELNKLSNENTLLGNQLTTKERLVSATQKQAALDAKDTLNKGSLRFKWGDIDYQDDLTAASVSISELNSLKKKRDSLKANRSEYSDFYFSDYQQEERDIASYDKVIQNKEEKLANLMSDISKTSQDLYNEDGSLVDEKNTHEVAAKINSLFDAYAKATDSTDYISDKINNIFAKSDFKDAEDQLIEAGKNGGRDAVKDKIDDISGLSKTLKKYGVDIDDLLDDIMSQARPEEKSYNGVMENFADMFGKKSKMYKFFNDKSKDDVIDFWDYLQNNNLDPKEYNWDEQDVSDNWDDYLKSKKSSTPKLSKFSSLFKNAAEDTATDIDTVTDNFQTDISNIKSTMSSLKKGELSSSDMLDLVQQFPELAGETDNLQQGLQNLALDKASTAIRKIRDSVKDTTDPKELAQADRYIQSIMDNLNTSEFDMSNAKDNVITSFSSIFVLN